MNIWPRYTLLWCLLVTTMALVVNATPLTKAVHDGDLTKIKELLEASAYINEPEVRGNLIENPLKIALGYCSKNIWPKEQDPNNRREIVKLLLQKGAYINEYYKQPGVINYSILYLAIETYDYELFNELLKHKMQHHIIVYDDPKEDHHNIYSINHALWRYNTCLSDGNNAGAEQLFLIIKALVDAGASREVESRHLKDSSVDMREYLRRQGDSL